MISVIIVTEKNGRRRLHKDGIQEYQHRDPNEAFKEAEKVRANTGLDVSVHSSFHHMRQARDYIRECNRQGGVNDSDRTLGV